MQNTFTVLSIVLAVVLVLLLIGGVGMMSWAGFGMMGPGMMHHGMTSDYGWGTNPLGMILSLVFWALVILGFALLAIWLVRSLSTTGTGSQTALEILKARYARGEISKDQFEQMKKDVTR